MGGGGRSGDDARGRRPVARGRRGGGTSSGGERREEKEGEGHGTLTAAFRKVISSRLSLFGMINHPKYKSTL